MTRYHLSPTETSERDITEWLGWFYRFHTDPEGLYIPYALRTIDCQVTTDGKAHVLHRCVREVVKFHGAQEVAWKLITWVPGLPGVQIQPYSTEDEAMDQMARPSQLVRFTKAVPVQTSG